MDTLEDIARFRRDRRAFVKCSEEDPLGWADEYEKRLSHLNRKNELRILVVGVSANSDILIWYDYFPNSHIYYVEDEGSDVAKYSGDRRHVLKGSLKSQQFLRSVVEPRGPFDLIVDRTGSEQVFNSLIRFLSTQGIYAIEGERLVFV